MASDSVSVSGPVNIQSDSQERVAFDLMQKIDYYSELDSNKKNKAYWLNLYSQCLKTVHGGVVSKILAEN